LENKVTPFDGKRRCESATISLDETNTTDDNDKKNDGEKKEQDVKTKTDTMRQDLEATMYVVFERENRTFITHLIMSSSAKLENANRITCSWNITRIHTRTPRSNTTLEYTLEHQRSNTGTN
jgi:hypothetical protein